MSFWYQKSTDFIVSLPIKQLGLISAWCSLWASRLICKLIRSKSKAVSCLLGTLELIISRCWNLASLPHWAVWPFSWVKTILEDLYYPSSQTRTGPPHGIHLFHTELLQSPQDADIQCLQSLAIFSSTWPTVSFPMPIHSPCTAKCHILYCFFMTFTAAWIKWSLLGEGEEGEVLTIMLTLAWVVFRYWTKVTIGSSKVERWVP